MDLSCGIIPSPWRHVYRRKNSIGFLHISLERGLSWALSNIGLQCVAAFLTVNIISGIMINNYVQQEMFVSVVRRVGGRLIVCVSKN
jgi:hypothetical protein